MVLQSKGGRTNACICLNIFPKSEAKFSFFLINSAIIELLSISGIPVLKRVTGYDSAGFPVFIAYMSLRIDSAVDSSPFAKKYLGDSGKKNRRHIPEIMFGMPIRATNSLQGL